MTETYRVPVAQNAHLMYLCYKLSPSEPLNSNMHFLLQNLDHNDIKDSFNHFSTVEVKTIDKHNPISDMEIGTDLLIVPSSYSRCTGVAIPPLYTQERGWLTNFYDLQVRLLAVSYKTAHLIQHSYLLSPLVSIHVNNLLMHISLFKQFEAPLNNFTSNNTKIGWTSFVRHEL